MGVRFFMRLKTGSNWIHNEPESTTVNLTDTKPQCDRPPHEPTPTRTRAYVHSHAHTQALTRTIEKARGAKDVDPYIHLDWCVANVIPQSRAVPCHYTLASGVLGGVVQQKQSL